VVQAAGIRWEARIKLWMASAEFANRFLCFSLKILAHDCNRFWLILWKCHHFSAANRFTFQTSFRPIPSVFSYSESQSSSVENFSTFSWWYNTSGTISCLEKKVVTPVSFSPLWLAQLIGAAHVVGSKNLQMEIKCANRMGIFPTASGSNPKATTIL